MSAKLQESEKEWILDMEMKLFRVFWLIQCALRYTRELVKPETLSGVATQVPVVKNERSIRHRRWRFSLVTLAGW